MTRSLRSALLLRSAPLVRHTAWLVLIFLLLAGMAMAQTDVDPPGETAAPDTPVENDEDSDPMITDVRLGFEGQQLLLSFKLLGAFDEDVRKRVDSGLPTSFTFEFELVRSRRSWFNTAVDSSSLQVGAMYNALNRQYLINYKHNGDLIRSKVVTDAAELEAAMTEFTDFPLFSTEDKKPDQRLRARVRAELRTRTIFFFIPSTVRTDWAATRKFRLSEELE